METLEVHSKDFLIKWVHAQENSTIEWQVKPLKRSINLAIYRKNSEDESLPTPAAPYSNGNGTKSSSSLSDSSAPPSGTSTPHYRTRASSTASVNQFKKSDNVYRSMSRRSSTMSTINQSDLALVKNYHRLIANEFVRGKFEVSKGGMYAFVFDNSFSKTISKKINFRCDVVTEETSSANTVPVFDICPPEDVDDVFENTTSRPSGEVLQSIMLKKRRKKLQGFTKRYFILNFNNGTLSYFRVKDNKLRGQMPIKESIVSANPATREFIIDSGMEVWHLRAINNADFRAWIDSFNKIKQDIYEREEDVKSTEMGFSRSILVQLQELQSKIALLQATQPSGLIDEITQDLSSIIGRSGELQPSGSVGYDEYSILSSEFYDAKETFDEFGVVILETEEKTVPEDEFLDHLSISSSEEEEESVQQPRHALEVSATITEAEEESLYPLPHDSVARDSEIPICTHTPPSILSFVRKNVGKDLSTLAMPVTYNEPTTALQKYAEVLEYPELINNALTHFGDHPGEKILRITTFALSYLSAVRSKERNKRKPFTPLLGETYELVREDLGFRMVSEKVNHKPPVFAHYIESEAWVLRFALSPTQKFWGKHSELTTKGTVILTDKATGEVFTWTHPTMLVKNIIAGETYAEPSGVLTVQSTSGYKAVAEFSKGGMFSGRSEGVIVKAYDDKKKEVPYTVSGKWTESFTLKTNTTEKCIWEAGDLLPQSDKKFGFTLFAGTLNKITDMERGSVAPTDSRLRPDLQQFEKGNVDKAEELKNKLEQDQRVRRKELEDKNEVHVPKFFRFVGTGEIDEGEWEYIPGEKSYWNRRKNQDWDDLIKLW
ncbi:Oxysterol-binding protein 3 [Spathaspora sp. JA1]|nr:Oxysterol-binding protein 3 [Spathaspora sp. JA1]